LQPVRLSALNAVVPVELVLHALPAGLANSLLTELLAQSEGWVAGSWWFGGQQQTAPRSSTTYLLKVRQVAEGWPPQATRHWAKAGHAARSTVTA
jgi:hypothetical protein